MKVKDTLFFSPKWYQIGDPDNIGMALAYGIIALASIWVLENLTERFLFSARLDIHHSEVAALVTFAGSSWIDIARWLLSMKSTTAAEPVDAASSKPSLNRRALLGVVLRIAIILADIAILFASVPRQIPVYENEVGATQVTLVNASKVPAQEIAGDPVYGISCNADMLSYEGFSATAVRQICMTAITHDYRSPSIEASQLRRFPRGTEIIFIMRFNIVDGLLIASLREQIRYIFTHMLKFREDNATSVFKHRTLFYPLPKGIVPEVLDSLFKGIPKVNRTCQIIPGGNNDKGISEAILCVPSKEEEIVKSQEIAEYLMASMGTRKIKAPKSKRKTPKEFVNSYPKVGSLNRPRLCIFPALIVLAALALCHILVEVILGSETLILKLWKLSNKCTKSAGDDNPLYAEKEVIPCFRLTGNRTYYLGSSKPDSMS